MILGTGIDIIEVARIASSYEKFGERFVNRILLPNEIAYCLAHKNPAPFLAARFAAKEAVSKCFTTGIGAEFGWKSASVYHGERHQPLVHLDEKGQALLASVGATHVILTLSHTDTVAMAVAALVRA